MVSSVAAPQQTTVTIGRALDLALLDQMPLAQIVDHRLGDAELPQDLHRMLADGRRRAVDRRRRRAELDRRPITLTVPARGCS